MSEQKDSEHRERAFLPGISADQQSVGSPDKAVAHKDGSADLSVDQKIQAIAACLSYSTYEANVYWQRNAIYLTINSIMAGAMAAMLKDLPHAVILGFGVFGLYFNWHWVHVNKYSKYLAERWREDARVLAQSSPELSEYLRALLRKPRIASPEGRRPSDVMNQLSASFRWVWALVTIYGLYLICSPIIRSWGSKLLSSGT